MDNYFYKQKLFTPSRRRFSSRFFSIFQLK